MEVSSVAGLQRIQKTPEIERENTGAGPKTRPGRLSRGRTTYRTWPVFSFALLALLGLMLVPAVTALRRSESIYDEVRTDQQQFQSTQPVFEALSQNVFSISLTIREFLLDSSPDAGRTYRGRLVVARDQLKADIVRLGQVLPPDGNVALPELKQEVDDYLAVVGPVFAWTAKERAERGVYFLREEQRPRRETIVAIAKQLSELNASVYAEQQRRTNENERRFRSELTQSVLFAFLTGIIVSTGGILRMRRLERRAASERGRAEQTTEEIRQLSMRLRQAQEEERRTISRELHDDVGQQLTAMRLELGTLEHLRSREGGEFDARLAELKRMAEQSVHVIRDIAAGLRPSVLDDLGLPAALQKQAREFSKRTGVVASVSVDGSFDQLRDPHRAYIYRIVQEALTNCAKHSDARRISVTLMGRHDNIELTVTDDGVGFDPRRMTKGGLGLIGLEERVRELGGVAEIRSAPGQGTAIHVTIPV